MLTPQAVAGTRNCHGGPVVAWTPVAGASSYTLHINRVDTDQTAYRETEIASSSLTLPDNLAPGEYRVWVQAINASNEEKSLWSVPLDFALASNKDAGNPPQDSIDSLLAFEDVEPVSVDSASSIRAHEPYQDAYYAAKADTAIDVDTDTSIEPQEPVVNVPSVELIDEVMLNFAFDA